MSDESLLKKIETAHPYIFTYAHSSLWYTPCAGCHEASVGMFGEGEFQPDSLILKTMGALYQGIIEPDDNIALRFGFNSKYTVIAIEWPNHLAPSSDMVDREILRKIREAHLGLDEFQEFYFLPTGKCETEKSAQIDEYLIGHLEDPTITEKVGKYRYCTLSAGANAQPERGLTCVQTKNVPKIPK